MRLSDYLPVTLAVLLGGLTCLGVAVFAAGRIERLSSASVQAALIERGQDWAGVDVDGLQVIVSGTAPDEAARFSAISAAGTVVDSSRVIDHLSVRASDVPAPPAFTVEILRNNDGISLIGLVPAATDTTAISERAAAIRADATVTDLLETADYPIPPAWEAALSFGLDAIASLPRSKVSVEAERVTVTAISDSAEAKRQIEEQLQRAAPKGVELVLAISAPRPVITPFTLRFLIDGQGARFDACTADSEAARDTILKAAQAAGLSSGANCTIGLGQPSPRWAEAVKQGIEAVAELNGGSVTFSDADVTLVAPKGARQADFDRIAGRLETSLPDVFSLTAIQAPPERSPQGAGTPEGPPEFIATRSSEGALQIRGRLPDARTRAAVISYAQARFGLANIEFAARIGDGLPKGWPLRVLASLEALSLLNSGAMVVTPDMVEIRGATGTRETQAEISRLLAANLGEDAEFTLEVNYVEELDPMAALPTPIECIARINAAMAARKITFAPGSTVIDAEALDTIDKIADVLRECQTVRIEIGGHTDSQGRESMNERLSQERADAVLNAIMSRRVLTANLAAKGYGESAPIADNKTEAGREANRRIEFQLVSAEQEDGSAETGETNEPN